MHHLVLRRYLLKGSILVNSLHLLRMHVSVFLSNTHLVLVTSSVGPLGTCPTWTTIDRKEVCLSVVSLVRYWLLLLPIICTGRFELGITLMIIRVLGLLQLLLRVPSSIIDLALVQSDCKVTLRIL